ncbi:MAG: topoisomerase [Bacteroidota bacterium]
MNLHFTTNFIGHFQKNAFIFEALKILMHMAKNLVIVESPAKAKTIEGYLGSDFMVKSSYGHVRDLPTKGDTAIDIENNFQPKYVISADKQKLVKELKSASKDKEVWLATDDDREGESISWHLIEALGLKADTKRIVFREITKSAITQAITNPRKIDMDLVNAQQARRVMDRLIGFELSPVLWKKVQRGLSAGRVQSVAVRLVVEREMEINGFESESYFKVSALFNLPGNKTLKAELKKNFSTEQEAQAFLESCKGAKFSIQNLEKKPSKKSPAAPFTTSTLQQEAARKLGYSVASTMQIAQKLYESGKITYMRTDSINLSVDALNNAKSAIVQNYGEKFSKTRNFKTKSQGAQEAHEAIRPTDFSQDKINGDSREKRLYDLIWKRAISSQMEDAQIEKTLAYIQNDKNNEILIAEGEVIKFEGFLKVYLEGNDNEEEDENKDMLPPLSIGEILDLNKLIANQRFSRPPARYTEASLVKALEEKGIGRPSTYAPTISTIIKREYVLKEDRDPQTREIIKLTLDSNNTLNRNLEKENFGAEKGKLFPTSIGIVVTDFLKGNFKEVVDFKFTAEMESEFDEIAQGKLGWTEMIKNFYSNFHQAIEDSESVKRNETGSVRVLGNHPENGEPIYAKIGKFGPYVQLGEGDEETKPIYVNIPKGKNIASISLEEAVVLFERPKLPRELGIFEELPLVIGEGKYGPYIRYDKKFTSLPKELDPYTISFEEAVTVLNQAKQAESNSILGEFEGAEVSPGKGRFGPYVKHLNKYYSLPKGLKLEDIDLAKAIEIIEAKRKTESNNIIKEFEENKNVRVLNGRYGPYIQIGKRNIKIPKEIVPEELTLEKCLELGS